MKHEDKVDSLTRIFSMMYRHSNAEYNKYVEEHQKEVNRVNEMLALKKKQNLKAWVALANK